jgi:glycosyltransferase involved in cell wall biosynthesis
MSYVKNKYINSPKIVLSRLGVFAPDDIQISKTTYHEFCIGIMSWFVEKKGIIYLLQAFKKLQKKGITNIKLRLAGDGPLKSQFLEFIGNNQLKNVEFVGKVYGAQKEKFFKSLDAFVLPSISLSNDMDGIPVVLMEAISYGLPIISTNISGIPEICINNYNGYLVEEKNITQLASSIIKLASQDNELFKENSLKLSEQYDIVVNSKNKLVKLNWI